MSYASDLDTSMQLNEWKSNLSPEVNLTQQTRPTATPQLLMMHLIYELMFILLHRPFFHRKQQHAGRQIDHRKVCFYFITVSRSPIHR